MSERSGDRPPAGDPPGGGGRDDAVARLMDAARPALHELVASYGLEPAQTAEVVRSALLAVMAEGIPADVGEGRRRLLKLVEAQCRELWRRQDTDDPETTS